MKAQRVAQKVGPKTQKHQDAHLQGARRRHEDTHLQVFRASGSQQSLGEDTKTRRVSSEIQGFRASGSQQGLGEDTKTRKHASSGLQGFMESAGLGRRHKDAKTRRRASSGLQGFRESAGLGRRHKGAKTRIFRASGLQGVSRSWVKTKTRRGEDAHLQGFKRQVKNVTRCACSVHSCRGLCPHKSEMLQLNCQSCVSPPWPGQVGVAHVTGLRKCACEIGQPHSVHNPCWQLVS